MTPPVAPAGLVQRAPLDVYKKITIIRKSTDSVVYEDSNGILQRITDLGDAAMAATPSLQPKVKLDIPVPTIKNVDSYAKDVPPTFEIPKSYVRYTRPTTEEIDEMIEYNVDEEDETWLTNHPRFGPNASKKSAAKKSTDESSVDTPVTNSSKKQKKSSSKASAKECTKNERVEQKLSSDDAPSSTDMDDSPDEDEMLLLHSHIPRRRPCLPLLIFEHMLDLLEKATAFETIITLSQAERLILGRIPQLLQIFGPSGGSAGPSTKGEHAPKRKKNPVTVRTVISAVYNYWVQKRSKLKKPLLRKYWPVTASNDTNPHLVFRPREKEKYKLRKKRQNDLDAYRKMHQLRTDFAKLRVLLDLVRRRENINKFCIEMQTDWFEQRIYDLIDTSGLPRESDRLSHAELDDMLNVPKYFDTNNMDRGKKKKRKRTGGTSEGRTSPMPLSSSTSPTGDHFHPDAISEVPPPPQQVVANQENPPLFLHPLSSRETYVTSWDNAVPFVNSYVNSHPTPTFRFRHRPRIGRGGRIIIDRLPRPGNPDIPPQNIFTVGEELPIIGPDNTSTDRLLDLLPQPLDHETTSRRIEEICASALSDDEEMANAYLKNTMAQGAGSTIEVDDNDGEEVMVKLDDWLETDEQIWGEERFAIGPV